MGPLAVLQWPAAPRRQGDRVEPLGRPKSARHTQLCGRNQTMRELRAAETGHIVIVLLLQSVLRRSFCNTVILTDFPFCLQPEIHLRTVGFAALLLKFVGPPPYFFFQAVHRHSPVPKAFSRWARVPRRAAFRDFRQTSLRPAQFRGRRIPRPDRRWRCRTSQAVEEQLPHIQ